MKTSLYMTDREIFDYVKTKTGKTTQEIFRDAGLFSFGQEKDETKPINDYLHSEVLPNHVLHYCKQLLIPHRCIK